MVIDQFIDDSCTVQSDYFIITIVNIYSNIIRTFNSGFTETFSIITVQCEGPVGLPLYIKPYESVHIT